MFVAAGSGSEGADGAGDALPPRGPELPDPAELTPDQLERELVGLAAQINAATCRWLALAAEYERRGAHETCGFASCASWLAWRCSLTPRAAREQLRVARDLEELPLIRAEFASGRLSYSKVRALTRVADGAMESDLIELAHESTAAQLERLMRAYRTATAETDQVAAERRYLSTRWEDDGTLSVHGSLPADEGALLLKALELARDELFASYVADAESDGTLGAGGEPPAAPDRADAMVALAETAIDRGVKAASGGDRHQVVIHVDATPRREDAAPATGHDGGADHGQGGGAPAEPRPLPGLTVNRASVDDTALSPEATRRLACDASIVSLVEAGGEPLSVGRKTRSIPPAIRRALNSRDRCCAYPGCEQERFVDAHHLRHWADGGETSLDNLVLLCRRHHRLVHEGGVTIEGHARAPRFRRRNGSLVDPSPQLPTLDGFDLAASMQGFASDEDPPWGKGERMDFDLATFVLAHLHETRAERAEGAESAGRPEP